MTLADIKTPPQIAEDLHRMDQAGSNWQQHLIRLAMVSALRSVILADGACVPLVLIVGGEAGAALAIPFSQAQRLMRWADLIVLCGTGRAAWCRALAMEAATQVRRAPLVEATGAPLPALLAWGGEVPSRVLSLGFKVQPGMSAHLNEKPPTRVLRP